MTEIKLEKLKEWGCNIDGALNRVLGDKDFYLECLEELLDDEGINKLKSALDSGDVEKAFFEAHTLKGLFSNFGLTPMYNKVCEIVEPLRANHLSDFSKEIEELLQMRTKLYDILHTKN